MKIKYDPAYQGKKHALAAVTELFSDYYAARSSMVSLFDHSYAERASADPNSPWEEHNHLTSLLKGTNHNPDDVIGLSFGDVLVHPTRPDSSIYLIAAVFLTRRGIHESEQNPELYGRLRQRIANPNMILPLEGAVEGRVIEMVNQDRILQQRDFIKLGGEDGLTRILIAYSMIAQLRS